MTAAVEREPWGPEFAGEVEALLAELGDTPRAVARSLINAGVTGIPDHGERCPIATYLRSRGFDVTEVDPTPRPRAVFGGVQLDDGRWHYPQSAVLPAAVRDFAVQFDHRKWPRLERAEVPA